MKATSKQQAERIAKAGAAKMTAETHLIKPSSIKRWAGVQFTFVNLESGARYTTSIDPANTFCSCPFYRENREHKACKHIVKAGEEAAWAASVEAREPLFTRPVDALA